MLEICVLVNRAPVKVTDLVNVLATDQLRGMKKMRDGGEKCATCHYEHEAAMELEAELMQAIQLSSRPTSSQLAVCCLSEQRMSQRSHQVVSCVDEKEKWRRKEY